jgi:PTS system nitrogen regulatory IIA component|tara:strand:- start:2185 stop:2643 length:459 start_codon:yes stop_codon:yes gene_type:complete
MINIKLDDSHISINDSCRSKKSILEKLSQLLSTSSGINVNEIFTELYEREKLGSTSVGYGVALPHARIKGIKHPFVSIIILDNPIDFDNIDNLDVDIVVCLIVPYEETENHLALLSNLSEILDQISNRKKLRSARNSQEILACLESTELKFI